MYLYIYPSYIKVVPLSNWKVLVPGLLGSTLIEAEVVQTMFLTFVIEPVTGNPL